MAKRIGGTPTGILVVNACLGAITMATGVVAGASVFGGVGVQPTTALFAIGCAVILHATFFAASLGTKILTVPVPETPAQPTTFGDWQVIAYDELGRVVDRNTFRDAMCEPGANQTDVQVPDIIVVARATALPVVDESDHTHMVRPDLPDERDEYRVYEVGEKSVGQVLEAWTAAQHATEHANGRHWYHDAPQTTPRSYTTT